MAAKQGVVKSLHRKAPKLTTADFQIHALPEPPVPNSLGEDKFYHFHTI